MSGIIVAFPKAQDGTAIKNLLVRNGYDVVSSCTTGAQAINLADNLGEGINNKRVQTPGYVVYRNIGEC